MNQKSPLYNNTVYVIIYVCIYVHAIGSFCCIYIITNSLVEPISTRERPSEKSHKPLAT